MVDAALGDAQVQPGASQLKDKQGKREEGDRAAQVRNRLARPELPEVEAQSSRPRGLSDQPSQQRSAFSTARVSTRAPEIAT